MQKYRVGMVFGVFDGLHPGHQHFLHKAAEQCEKLVVVVARPEIVLELKQRLPHHTAEERQNAIQLWNPNLEVTLGDTTLGTWSTLRAHHPDIVFLGYDQTRLEEALAKLGIATQVISPHYPEKYKSSLLQPLGPQTH